LDSNKIKKPLQTVAARGWAHNFLIHTGDWPKCWAAIANWAVGGRFDSHCGRLDQGTGDIE